MASCPPRDTDAEEKPKPERQQKKQRTQEVLLGAAKRYSLKQLNCECCDRAFTAVMTIEEQRSNGLSLDQFKQLNLLERTCWRNAANPCGHATVTQLYIRRTCHCIADVRILFQRMDAKLRKGWCCCEMQSVQQGSQTVLRPPSVNG